MTDLKPRNIFVLSSPFLSSENILADNRQSMMMRCGHYKGTKVRAPAVLAQTLLSPLLHREGCIFLIFPKAQLNSVTQSCPTLCNLMDCSMPGFSIHHQLPELTQTQVHQVGDAIQLSHPLLSPSLPAFSISQHQGLPVSQFFVSSGQNIGASATASVLPMNIQALFPLGWTGLISL